MKAHGSKKIEQQFAVKGSNPRNRSLSPPSWQRAKAVQQLTTYWSLLEQTRGSSLKLTKIDDEILQDFKENFPDFDPAATIDEEKMKGKEGKEKWRLFMLKYENSVSDYNFGTILRTNPKFEYGEKETIFGKATHMCATNRRWCRTAMRMQFYAIEIARWVHLRAFSWASNIS